MIACPDILQKINMLKHWIFQQLRFSPLKVSCIRITWSVCKQGKRVDTARRQNERHVNSTRPDPSRGKEFMQVILSRRHIIMSKRLIANLDLRRTKRGEDGSAFSWAAAILFHNRPWPFNPQGIALTIRPERLQLTTYSTEYLFCWTTIV